MHVILIRTFILVVLCVSSRKLIHAQLDLSRFEIGMGAGVFVYQGDLSPSPLGSYRTLGPAIHFFVSRKMGTSFSLRTNIAAGKISGDDNKFTSPSWRQQRNFKFSSPVFELSQLAVWHPIEFKKLSPYLFAGAGVTLLNIKRDWSRLNPEYFSSEDPVHTGLQYDINHSLPTLIPVVPFGVGIRYKLNKNISIMAETTYRLSATDYLDGFSHSARPSMNDHYFSHTAGLIYSFGKRSGLECPVIKK